MKRAIQICGTGSGVGKSVLVSGFCRILRQDGYNVAPFKAQNMALNSYVTKSGGEIGRAQAVQAQAAKVEPTVEMNPILIKPNSDTGAQIILNGKPIGNMSALEYTSYKKRAKATVLTAYAKLAKKFDTIVMEGAGSPAEINLRAHDIVNIKMAIAANANVILVGDIDKGGVFAWLIGTLDLLTQNERKRVKGFIINKFRGDIRLLTPGLKFLEKHTGLPVLGVIPYFRDIDIPEEDSVFLSKIEYKPAKKNKAIKINVIYLPHISNFTDFDTLEKEPDVSLTYIRNPQEIKNPDIIIIPGTKNTISDLHYLQESGFITKIEALVKTNKTTLIGICGGFQMLGHKIIDQLDIESTLKKIDGLNLLPITTTLKITKTLAQTTAIDLNSGEIINGYEIHHGKTTKLKKIADLFQIKNQNGKAVQKQDGVISANKKIWGTYIHGLFDNNKFRRDFLNTIRKDKNLKPLNPTAAYTVDQELDKLANLLREHIDMNLFYKILNKEI